MNNELKKVKNSTLLKELKRRIEEKEIRFDYDNIYPPQHIIGLISWNSLDEYTLDFPALEKFEEKEQVELKEKQQELTNHE